MSGLLAENELDLAGRRCRGIRAVAQVLRGAPGIESPQAVRGLLDSELLLGWADDLPPLGDRIRAGKLEGDDGARGHVAGKVLVEWLANVLGVELGGEVLIELHGLHADDLETLLDDAVDDLAPVGLITWLDHGIGVLLRHFKVTLL